jgi:hypothetical protein
MFYIGLFIIFYGIMYGIRRLCDKRWGFIGVVWANRIILTTALVPLIIFNSTPQADTASMWMMYILSILWGFNVIVYNPWALPEIVKKHKELENCDKDKPIY